MIARFGAFELSTLVNYLGVKQQNRNIWKYIKGRSLPWWWNEKLLNHMQNNAGFFPPTIEKIEQFCELMLEDMKEVDILGSWLEGEKQFEKEMGKCIKVNFELLNPYFSIVPWTKALEGKKILVVHPFASTIEKQYDTNRHKLFDNKDILPAFKLKTLKAVQSIAGEKTRFNDWFEALAWMEAEIDKTEYDICLIGAGAYGFPLAAHVKRQGKKAIHIGGSLQLLFGIKGKRWEDSNYNSIFNYSDLMNKHWVYPSNNEKLENAKVVEGACYW
jgi:hypothetical protein